MTILVKMINYWSQTSSFFRYICIGLLNTFISLFLIYFLFFIFEYSYWTSTFIGNFVGVMNSFLLNRKFTFKSKQSIIQSFVPFISVTGGAYFLSYFTSDKISSLFPFSKKETAILLGMCLYTITNYLGQKHLVFTDRKKSHSLIKNE